MGRPDPHPTVTVGADVTVGAGVTVGGCVGDAEPGSASLLLQR